MLWKPLHWLLAFRQRSILEILRCVVVDQTHEQGMNHMNITPCPVFRSEFFSTIVIPPVPTLSLLFLLKSRLLVRTPRRTTHYRGGAERAWAHRGADGGLMGGAGGVRKHALAFGYVRPFQVRNAVYLKPTVVLVHNYGASRVCNIWKA